MKIRPGIIIISGIIAGIIISNSVAAQDTTDHTRLVDKYYPKSNSVAQPAPINSTELNQPVSNKVSQPKPVDRIIQPVNSTVSQPTPINRITNQPATTTIPMGSPTNKITAEVAPVVQTPVTQTPVAQASVSPNAIYQDTRLGSSSPQNSTYQTNNNGAGSVTTDPNKGVGSNVSTPQTDTNVAPPVYRDTRLGSSSPLYNTYQKNDNGAGAVTTNPNKG